jgi:hypothetical protein
VEKVPTAPFLAHFSVINGAFYGPTEVLPRMETEMVLLANRHTANPVRACLFKETELFPITCPAIIAQPGEVSPSLSCFWL